MAKLRRQKGETAAHVAARAKMRAARNYEEAHAAHEEYLAANAAAAKARQAKAKARAKGRGARGRSTKGSGGGGG